MTVQYRCRDNEQGQNARAPCTMLATTGLGWADNGAADRAKDWGSREPLRHGGVQGPMGPEMVLV
jgi:hypothetical protein